MKTDFKQIGEVKVALIARKGIAPPYRWRLKPPDITQTSIRAAIIWNIGVEQQDKPIGFYIKIFLLVVLLSFSIARRIIG